MNICIQHHLTTIIIVIVDLDVSDIIAIGKIKQTQLNGWVDK